jgi:hypothetical protein
MGVVRIFATSQVVIEVGHVRLEERDVVAARQHFFWRWLLLSATGPL